MKSTLLKFFLTLSAVLLFGLNASAQGTTKMGTDGFPTNKSDIKFFFSVTGFSQLGGAGNSSTVYATVFDGNQDYNFEVVLPKKTNVLCSDQATVRAMMRNVASLDVDANETRTHEVTINTGTKVTNQTLGGWLPLTYQFQNATLPITVVDYNHGAPIYKEFEYQLKGAPYGDGYRITGKRNDFQKAHDAWYLITKGPENINPIHVTAERKGDEDTFLDLPVGAYIQLGKEMITVDSEIKMSEGNFDLNTLCSMFKTPTTVTNAEQKAIFYLPAGTKLSIGASIATLNEAAKITFDLTNMPQGYTLDGVLSTLAEKAAAVQSDPNGESGTSAKGVFIQTFLNMFDQLVAAVNAAKTVPVLVEFGQPGPFIEVYHSDKTGAKIKESALQTPDQFRQTLTTYPNAIGLVRSQYATPMNIAAADAVNNTVIEYKVGHSNNGYYYECKNLVLIDTESGVQVTSGFYSPVNFVAISGNYTRNFTRSNSAVCVPFALDKTELFDKDGANNISMITFAYYEPKFKADGTWNSDDAYVYFNLRNSVGAGVPFMTYDYTRGQNTSVKAGKLVKNFNMTDIVASPENSANLQGTFLPTKEFAVAGHFYGPDTQDRQLAPIKSNNTVYAFRSVLGLNYDTEYNDGHNNTGNATTAKVIKIAIIDENGDATSIDGVYLGNKSNPQNNIYTINGVKVSSMSKPGLYIVNGKKVLVK